MMCLSGVLCAAVFVTTAYLHIPSNTGYIHLGDALIYLSACLLPMPYAIFVGSFGAVLADLLSGYTLWAPGTFIIKALAVLCFMKHTYKFISVRNLISLIPASLLCVFGYYFYEALLTLSLTVPLASIMGNVVQAVAGSISFMIFGIAADKLKLKEKLHLGGKSIA